MSPLELLFDLVFVLGVSQLTRHLGYFRNAWRGSGEEGDNTGYSPLIRGDDGRADVVAYCTLETRTLAPACP